MKKKILILNGPNLNKLGTREPDIYGVTPLDEIEKQLTMYAIENHIELKMIQSNTEGVIIDEILDAPDWADGIIINPGAYAHYSYAIRDAIAAINIPVVEVHISNIFSREEFRHRTPVASVCTGLIVGFGWRSYLVGLKGIMDLIESERTPHKTDTENVASYI